MGFLLFEFSVQIWNIFLGCIHVASELKLTPMCYNEDPDITILILFKITLTFWPKREKRTKNQVLWERFKSYILSNQVLSLELPFQNS